MAKTKGSPPPIPDDFMICPGCAKLMGYRHPHPHNLDHFDLECGHCGRKTGVVRKVDLFPPDEEIPFDE